MSYTKRTYGDLLESLLLMSEEELNHEIAFVDGVSSNVKTMTGAGEFNGEGFIIQNGVLEEIPTGFMTKELNLGGVVDGQPIFVVNSL